MSKSHRVSVLHITESVPEPYNYLSNSRILGVHYYNGNSFRLSPFQDNWGPIVASGGFERHCAGTRPDRVAIGEGRRLGRDKWAKMGIRFLDSRGIGSNSSAIANRD